MTTSGSVPGGVCLWFTGRSGAGKSTVTNALLPMLDAAGRTVTVLDVVPVLAKGRGERSSEGKLLRKAFVAGEVARHGGIAIAVTVSARAEVREAARRIVGPERFLEIYTEVPAELSRARKQARTKKPSWRKRAKHALRAAKSRRTNEPAYEPPLAPALTIRTDTVPPEENAQAIFDLLVARGIVRPAPVA